MAKKFFIILSVFFAIILYFANTFADTFAVVNIPVANMYKQPNNDSALVSQAIYGTRVKLIDSSGNNWLKINTPDVYVGWVPSSDIVYSENKHTRHSVKVENLFAHIYIEPNTMTYKPLLTVPFATQLPVTKFYDKRWIQVGLFNGNYGWIQSGDVAIDPKPLTMQQMLKLSKKFIGLPFTWGGVSSYGFDCSGFVQMLYKQMGVVLPRDAGLQAKWPGLVKVKKQNLQPGDILYFGWDKVISHEAIYLGNGQIIHSTAYQNPIVQISNFNDPYWQGIYITARRLKSQTNPDPVVEGFVSSIQPLSNNVKQQMLKYTWHKGCPLDLKYLVYLKLSYWGFDNKPHQGVLIVNKYLAPEIAQIFKDLYNQKFPIEKMQPMYLYKGDDNTSMLDDNTSAFNCRKQTDFSNLFSIHSYGGAIDINPLINPYVNGNKVEPPEGRKYLNIPHKGKIIANSEIVKIFAKYGWRWGASWPGQIHDYQHFEKPFQ